MISPVCFRSLNKKKAGVLPPTTRRRFRSLRSTSIDSNLAWLHPLRFRQCQGQYALLHSSCDFRGIDRGIQFEHATIIELLTFLKEWRALDFFLITMAEDRNLIAFKCN